MKTSVFDQIKYFFQQKSMLVSLVKINIFVWLPIAFISLLSSLFQSMFAEELLNWLAVPSSIDRFISRPWTLLTYMFLHKDFLHILFNMLMLYFGGTLFIQFIGEKKLLQTYILGGILGGIFYMGAFNIFPVFEQVVNFSVALGASASVIAILIAIATYVPETRVQLMFLGSVKLKYIAIVLILFDLLSIEKGNPGGHIAHLGGAFYGALFALNLKYRLLTFPDFNFKKLFVRKHKLKYTKNPSRPVSDEKYNEMKLEKQKRIDEILDKISKSGYEKLSKEEKEFLFKSSNN
jgi:membrane associated rhomboid family serine protease